MDTRFDGIDRNLGHMDQKIDALGDRLDGKIDALSDRVGGKVDGLGERMDRLVEALVSGGVVKSSPPGIDEMAT